MARNIKVNENKTASMHIDLHAGAKNYRVSWMRADNGEIMYGEDIVGGKEIMLTAPWKAKDVILYLQEAVK